FDLRAAWPALRRTAFAPVPPDAPVAGRGGITDYMTRGWIPIESSGASVSVTLEYAYDDFALAILADALGETADRDALRMRAGNWRGVWDASAGFFLGRHADGQFAMDIDPTVGQPFFAEGNAWQ